MSATTTRSHEHSTYRHEALLWDSTETFLRRTVPFVTDAVTLGEPVMVAVTDTLWEPLADALGDVATHVEHADMADLGRNPARILPAWFDFVERNGQGAVPLRGVGEPVWSSRTAAEVAEGQVHEALLNAAVPAGLPLWLLCPYDVRGLDESVLAEACRSHPAVGHGGVATPSPLYAGVEHPRRLSEQPLPTPRGPVTELGLDRRDLPGLRAQVSRWAAAHGLTEPRAQDLVLAVHELAANALDHGVGAGTAHLWVEDGALLVEVRDEGRMSNLLAGRSLPAAGHPRGRGLWMVHRLCDLVQVRTGDGGTVVRVSSWL